MVPSLWANELDGLFADLEGPFIGVVDATCGAGSIDRSFFVVIPCPKVIAPLNQICNHHLTARTEIISPPSALVVIVRLVEIE